MAGSSTTSRGIPALRRQSRAQFLAYGFRSRAGKAIVAYWLAAHSLPGNVFPPLTASLAAGGPTDSAEGFAPGLHYIR